LADLFTRHQTGENQRRGPSDRDHVQADDQAEAFHAAGDADYGRQDAASPSMIASQNSQLSATTAGITGPPRR